MVMIFQFVMPVSHDICRHMPSMRRPEEKPEWTVQSLLYGPLQGGPGVSDRQENPPVPVLWSSEEQNWYSGKTPRLSSWQSRGFSPARVPPPEVQRSKILPKINVSRRVEPDLRNKWPLSQGGRSRSKNNWSWYEKYSGHFWFGWFGLMLLTGHDR